MVEHFTERRSQHFIDSSVLTSLLNFLNNYSNKYNQSWWKPAYSAASLTARQYAVCCQADTFEQLFIALNRRVRKRNVLSACKPVKKRLKLTSFIKHIWSAVFVFCLVVTCCLFVLLLFTTTVLLSPFYSKPHIYTGAWRSRSSFTSLCWATSPGSSSTSCTSTEPSRSPGTSTTDTPGKCTTNYCWTRRPMTLYGFADIFHQTRARSLFCLFVCCLRTVSHDRFHGRL